MVLYKRERANVNDLSSVDASLDAVVQRLQAHLDTAFLSNILVTMVTHLMMTSCTYRVLLNN